MGNKSALLLVDDEPSVRAIGALLFARLGFEVVTANDGCEALDRYQPGRFACVILDLTMPRLDGVDTLRELRRRDAAARVILATGHDEDDVRARLGDLQPAAFLEKPYTLESLGRVLSAILP